jgi:putative ABC transport system permease protein
MIWNAFLLALREIRRNVMRSFLTTLGIVIGVAGVIIMVTIGGGTTAEITKQIASLGSNMLIITPGKRLNPGQAGVAAAFKLNDAEAMARDLSSIVAVAPSSSSIMTAIVGNENWSTRVTGSDNGYLKAGNWSINAGRQFSGSELRAGAAVCIVGATVRAKLFGAQDPLGNKIRLQRLACEVIGLLAAKGQSVMGTDQDDFVLIPLRTFQRRIAGNQDVGMIQVSVQGGVPTQKVEREIGRLLRERRHLSTTDEDDFSVMDLKEITKMLTGTTQVLTAAAAVSLLVGGIGIMNIMLVSVTERTREIGIRLAIGALEGEVLLQFLVEAMVLSSLGGLLGIVLAIGASFGLAGVVGVPFVFNPGIVAVGFLFSAGVGVVFGFFPAQKAARLDPIEALRRE